MSENGSRGARRCLFGREDPERLSLELAEQVKKEEIASAEAFERRWNFKITNETPLPGRFQWEKIDNKESEQSTSRSVSHLPLSPATDESVETSVNKIPPDPDSENEKSCSLNDKSVLSTISTLTDSDISKPSSSSDERDLNENIVTKESSKRKAPERSHNEEKIDKEAKRAKPP